MRIMIVILLAVSILMPLYYAYRLLRLDEPSRLTWLIVAADSTVFVSLVFLVGRWDIAGYYTRLLLLGLFIATLLRSLRAHRSRPWPATSDVWRHHRSTLLTLVLFSAALVYVLSGMLPPARAKSLAFPLDGGRFVVAQGGGVTVLNHHANHSEQRFAADITAIFPSGFRAHGILPGNLADYAAFGAYVVSPCAGEVLATRADLADLVPPDRDRDHPSGNYIILECGELRVELAHLMQGSLEVTAGDQVAVGDNLGKVGNSGNTTEPHLHIHAYDPATGNGVPIAFDGRFPVRNSLFRR